MKENNRSKQTITGLLRPRTRLMKRNDSEAVTMVEPCEYADVTTRA